jgi:hypothetical protein
MYASYCYIRARFSGKNIIHGKSTELQVVSHQGIQKNKVDKNK